MISTAHRIQPNYWEQALQPNEVVVRLGRFNFLKKRKTEVRRNSVSTMSRRISILYIIETEFRCMSPQYCINFLSKLPSSYKSKTAYAGGKS